MYFKTCRIKHGGCGYSFKTQYQYAHLCGKCKEKKKTVRDIKLKMEKELKVVKLNDIAGEMALRAVRLAERQRTVDIVEFFRAQDDDKVAGEIENAFLQKVGI